MAKKELLTLLQSASVKDLKELLALKKELDELEKKQKELLKQFTSVSKELGSIQTTFGKSMRKKPATRVKKATKKAARKPAKKKTKKRAKRRGTKKRVVQPSLSSLIVEILKEKKPLGVNDICDALLKEKKYKTKAKNFKANVRILLYKNEKGLFKKAGPGRFRLAAKKR